MKGLKSSKKSGATGAIPIPPTAEVTDVNCESLNLLIASNSSEQRHESPHTSIPQSVDSS